MKKLFIDREEAIAPLVERVISDDDGELVLVIPKNSVLKETVSNFHILEREADAAGKSILIETVDAEVLALANKAKIESFHPLFQDAAKSRSLSDIRVGSEDEPERGRSRRSVDIKLGRTGRAKVKIAGKSLPVEEVPMPIEPEQEHEEPSEVALRDVAEEQRFREEEARFTGGESQPVAKVSPSRRFGIPRVPSVRLGKRGIIVLVTLAVVAAGGVWSANTFFARATVSIAFKTTEWNKDVQMLASKSVSKPSSGGTVIPSEALSQTKNTTQFFPASGKAVVSLKAATRITIYNAYSSQAQSLVATTRFQTPDGKIFRLDKGITVPGAEIKDGKIIPSSIEADATADQPGDAHNIGPIPKLTIPGFKGSPKFDGFYGEMKEKAIGGATGERPVPTDADIATAKEKVTEVLRSTLQSNFLSSRPEDFKIIDGASELTITRMTVNQATDEKGQFSVFGEGQYRAVVFRETDLTQALLAVASEGKSHLGFRTFTPSYKNPKVDFTKGELSFTVSGKGVLATAFDAESFKAQIASKDVASARSLIAGLPDLQEGRIALWPIWLGKVPGEAKRITIEVQ